MALLAALGRHAAATGAAVTMAHPPGVAAVISEGASTVGVAATGVWRETRRRVDCPLVDTVCVAMPADTGARTAVVPKARLRSANLVLSSSRSNTPSVKVAISLAMAYAASTNSLSPAPATSPRTWTANQRSKSRSVDWPLATLASRALRSRRMSTPDKPFDYLDPAVLRRLFNDQQIPEKAIAGDLREDIRPQTHLSARRRARLTIRGRHAHECTHTCTLTYID